MSKQLRYLPGHLTATADAARLYMQKAWGVSSGKIEFEEKLDGDITPTPTLQAPSQDHHIICIEVSERAFPSHLKIVIADCMQRSLPVLMYVAMPAASPDPEDLTQAKRFGVGLLMVGSSCEETLPAHSLSLVGVRDPEPHKWPARYRARISEAYKTFRAGDPSKGCGLVFELIEQQVRKLYLRAASKGWWHNLPATRKVLNAANKKVTLEQLASFLYEFYDASVARTPNLDKKVLGAVVGSVGARNDYAHPPKTLKARQQRDERARTRFENAIDTLRDLVTAAAPLRLPVS